MILWGRSYPYFILASGIVDEEFNSNTLDNWVDLDHNKIIPYTEVVTSTDGSTTYIRGTDYQMDYEDGQIKCLSTGSMSASTDYLIDYDYTVYEEQMGDNDGVEFQFYWEKDNVNQLTAQSGKIYELKLGWRLFLNIKLFEWDSYTLSDFFRMVYSWPTEDTTTRKVYVWPRPGYLGGYIMIPGKKYETKYLENKWYPIVLEFEFKSMNVFDNLPSHNSMDNADIEFGIPWIKEE